MNQYLARWNALPRAARWGAWFCVVLAGYFAILEPALDLYNKWSMTSASKEAQLAQFARGADALKATSSSVLLGVSRYGRVEYPGDPESRPVEFNRAISDVMNKHGVKNYTSTSRNAPIGANSPLGAAVGGDSKVERIVKDIQFDAEPEAVTAVIAELERHPLVTTISRVQIRKGDSRDSSSRIVKASLAVETWMISKKGKAR